MLSSTGVSPTPARQEAGDDDPSDAGTATLACDGLNEWFAGTMDPEVKHFGEKYTCLVAGWCSASATNSVAAYEPGKGWAWTDAWEDSGPCPASLVGGP